MKRLLLYGAPLLLPLGLCACDAGEHTAGISFIYGITAALSLLLLIGCALLVRQNKRWFILLFSSVFVVNAGYTLLALSGSLQMALWANRIAYLGSVFLPFSMLMIILKVTATSYRRWVPISLCILSCLVFLVAASPGILPIYYKEVSFEIVDGIATLVKDYGPLHPLYLFYLLGYFAVMVFFIARTSIKKTTGSTSHAMVLAIAVFVNIGVWLIEQVTSIPFEFLSVSYIISELFLLGLHLVATENLLSKDQIAAETVPSAPPSLPEDDTSILEEAPSEAEPQKEEKPAKKGTEEATREEMECFLKGMEALTLTERAIFDAYLAGTSTKEILSSMNIKENTLKFHNKNIYGKLGVCSRRRLVFVYRAIEEEQKKIDPSPFKQKTE